MELEVLSPGCIKGWEGCDVSQLGEIIFMDLVHFGEHLFDYVSLILNLLLFC